MSCREPYGEPRAPKVLTVLLRELGFRATLSLLIALEREGMRRARVPSPRRLRQHLLHRIPRRADRDLVAAELGVDRRTVDYFWRRRHGRRR